MKFTIQDLAYGKCAVVNDGSLEELREVLKLAFPDDETITSGSFRHYMLGSKYEWMTSDFTHLPTQSVKEFLKNKVMTKCTVLGEEPKKEKELKKIELFACMQYGSSEFLEIKMNTSDYKELKLNPAYNIRGMDLIYGETIRGSFHVLLGRWNDGVV
jgi:hypothetical protein